MGSLHGKPGRNTQVIGRSWTCVLCSGGHGSIFRLETGLTWSTVSTFLLNHTSSPGIRVTGLAGMQLIYPLQPLADHHPAVESGLDQGGMWANTLWVVPLPCRLMNYNLEAEGECGVTQGGEIAAYLANQCPAVWQWTLSTLWWTRQCWFSCPGGGQMAQQ